MIPQYSLVRSLFPLPEDEIFVFLGEIPNMPGHCIVIGRDTGNAYIGYHVNSFTVLSEDET